MKWIDAVIIVLLAGQLAVSIGREPTLPRGQVTYRANWKTRLIFKSKKNPLTQPRGLAALTGKELVFAATGALVALGLLLLTPWI